MFKGKVKSIIQDRIVETGERFMSIELDIMDESGNVVETRKIGFPLSKPYDNIVSELKNQVSVIESDEMNKVKNAKLDEETNNFNEVEGKIKELEI